MKIMLVVFLAVSTVGYIFAAPPATSTEELLGQYFAIQKSLASDSTSGVAASATQLAKIARRAAGMESQSRTQLLALADTATRFKAADLKLARGGFGELSDTLIAYLQAAGTKRNPPYQFFCSMVKKNWLQPDRETRNPYYGRSMPKCGELVLSEQSIEQPAAHHQH